ncbi:MAG: thymidine phosphorylase [Defluviitaleaceae bacterium]|nr:thymidine phosphorylase [Defluviitaleaceae bacterium]
MRIYEIINKKKRNNTLTAEEIYFAVNGFVDGTIPDYQMSALLMAIYFNGMNAAETTALTMAMVDSGEVLSGLDLGGITVDKHSTGGVGDKTTLAVVPIVAACGIPIAKMSGRGLGHTGGTIDKLEAIAGFKTSFSAAEFLAIIKKHGLCIAGQSANLAPADKKIYALRDATATVDSIPLIAASIMSKKIAAGADAILLDVKTGNGAFMKNLADAEKLAHAMVEIGEGCGRKMSALITDMSAPLGCAIGNALEVREVVLFLQGKRNPLAENLYILCEELAAEMLTLAGHENAREAVQKALASGGALQKFMSMVEAQGGNTAYVENLAREQGGGEKILAPESGYICELDTEGIGIAAMLLGAGRKRKEDAIDYTAGIELKFARGSLVEKGQVVAEFFTENRDSIAEARERFLGCITFSQERVAKSYESPVIARIGG